MKIELIIFLLTVHWIADFVFQDEEWALNKSKNWDALVSHTSVYSFILLLAFIPILGLLKAISFAMINYVAHTGVDFITSRIVAKRFKTKYLGGRIPNFGAFSIIGLDQLIYYTILLITLQWHL